MTLRQQYAMAVLAGAHGNPEMLQHWTAGKDTSITPFDRMAQQAFKQADAMLKYEGFEVEALQGLIAALGPVLERGMHFWPTLTGPAQDDDKGGLTLSHGEFLALFKAFQVAKGVK